MRRNNRQELEDQVLHLDMGYRWNDWNFEEGNDSVVEIELRHMLAAVVIGSTALFHRTLMIAARVLRQCFRQRHMLCKQQEQAEPDMSKKARFHWMTGVTSGTYGAANARIITDAYDVLMTKPEKLKARNIFHPSSSKKFLASSLRQECSSRNTIVHSSSARRTACSRSFPSGI